MDNKIEEAASAYGTNNDYSVIGPDGRMSLKPELETAFETGAHYAINEFLKDLWHPASEEPDVRHKTIICLYEDGHICQDYDAYDEATESDKLGRKEFKWNYYAEDNEIKKWCYATDLLPKKGGEQ